MRLKGRNEMFLWLERTQCGGLESLVSVLANHSSYKNVAVRKNAAAAIARMVKSDEKAMERCRELRGMEILIELGRTGKV